MFNSTDEQEIIQLFVDGDRALRGADLSELRRIYADDYIQFDERGRITTREQLVQDLISHSIRFASINSKGRQVRLLEQNVAVIHGSEEDEIEQNGRRLQVNYLYTDVVIKREGRWQIVASQLVKQS